MDIYSSLNFTLFPCFYFLKVGVASPFNIILLSFCSKSEYVRCLRFSSERTIYVATNHGYLYHATLSDSMGVMWTKLIHVGEEVQIICMDLLACSPFEVSGGAEDWIALGDSQGRMTVLKVLHDSNAHTPDISFTWSAEKERQLLGTFWCKSLGFRWTPFLIFNSDNDGTTSWNLYISLWLDMDSCLIEPSYQKKIGPKSLECLS